MIIDVLLKVVATDPHATTNRDVRKVPVLDLPANGHVRYAEVVGDLVNRQVFSVHYESPRIDLMRYRVSKLRPPIFPLTKSEAQLLDLPTEDAIFD